MQFLIPLLPFFLPFALCIPLLATRNDCPTPTSAKVTPFNDFTAEINPTYRSAVSFTFSDEATGITTDCQHLLPLGQGGSPSDPNNYYPCNNTAVEFKYSGNGLLALKETYDCNGEAKTTVGTGDVPLVCFFIPGYFYGAGTLCTTPTEWVSVSLY